MLVINPRRACAARVTVVVLSFCVSVCYQVFCRYKQQDGPKSDSNGLSAILALFNKNIFGYKCCIQNSFEIYGVKQSEGANMQISTGLP